MSNEANRFGATRRVVALACSVVLTALGSSPAFAAEPAARTRSAELSVSVSVVRKCVVQTPALIVVGDDAQDGATTLVAESVALSCVQSDAAAVEVGAPSMESALYAQLAREDGGASDPLVVTVLF